jgi:hypothetical protein
MASHTPGPWTLDFYGDNEIDVYGSDETLVCAMRGGSTAQDDDESSTLDAQLVAAAPELLESLREAERVMRWAAQMSAGRVRADVVGGWLDHARRASAVIDKAEGRT